MQITPTALAPGKAGALTGKKCRVCSLPHKIVSAVDQKLRGGERVTAVHRWLKKNFPTESAKVSYDVLAAHHRDHVKLIDRAATKLSDADRLRREKVRLAKAVVAGEVDPQAYFGPAAIAQDIAKTSVRLDLAADEAFLDGEHASLAALSNSLLRSHEIRAKMGGSIADRNEVSVTVSLQDLHARLDNVLAIPAGDRQASARALLGLPTPDPAPQPVFTGVDAASSPPEFARTIDAEPAPTAEPMGTRYREP